MVLVGGRCRDGFAVFPICWPNRIVSGKWLLADVQMRIAWHQHIPTQGKGTLWFVYGVSMALQIQFCLAFQIPFYLTINEV